MIDPQCHIVKVCDEEIDLYPKEIDVLYFLARYPGWVLTPECNYCCSARVVATVKSTFSIFSSHFGKRRMRE